MKADGNCEDDNNHCGCQWDGGDCCGSSGKATQYSPAYCKICKCLDPSHKLTKASLTAHMYKCTCDPGWQGKNCDTDINDCKKDICKNGGTCKDAGVNKYVCECTSGWGGQNCADDILDHCSPYKCEKKCGTQKRFKDTVCDTENNHCGCDWDGGDCCGNDGAKGEQYLYCKDDCICKKDALGSKKGAKPDCLKKCGIAASYVGDGTCDDENNHCGCNWDGGDCCGISGKKDQFDWCDDCTCHKLETVCKHGDCSDLGNYFKCKCSTGWQGAKCDVDINDCFPDPCSEFGKCKDLGVEKYECECSDGWNGKHCEISDSGEVLTTTTSTTSTSTSTSSTSTSTTTTSTTTIAPFYLLKGGGVCADKGYCVLKTSAACQAGSAHFEILDRTATVQKKTGKPAGCYVTSKGNLNFNEHLGSLGKANGLELLICRHCPPSVCKRKPCNNGECANAGEEDPEKGYTEFKCTCSPGWRGVSLLFVLSCHCFDLVCCLPTHLWLILRHPVGRRCM